MRVGSEILRIVEMGRRGRMVGRVRRKGEKSIDNGLKFKMEKWSQAAELGHRKGSGSSPPQPPEYQPS